MTLIGADLYKNGTGVTDSSSTATGFSKGSGTAAAFTSDQGNTALTPIGAETTASVTTKDFSAVALGNIDNDSGIDFWFIATQQAAVTAASADCIGSEVSDTQISAGTPGHTFNDVDC